LRDCKKRREILEIGTVYPERGVVTGVWENRYTWRGKVAMGTVHTFCKTCAEVSKWRESIENVSAPT